MMTPVERTRLTRLICTEKAAAEQRKLAATDRQDQVGAAYEGGRAAGLRWAQRLLEDEAALQEG